MKEGANLMEDLDVDDRMLLTCVWKTEDEKYWLDSCLSGQRLEMDCCAYGNERVSSIQYE